MRRLGPGETVLYAWQDPLGKRELMWSCGEAKHQVSDLLKDGLDGFLMDSDTKLYWGSFLDGMQRVLLFTDDFALATISQQVLYISMSLCLCICRKNSHCYFSCVTLFYRLVNWNK